jgi:hypothetical protein
VKVVVTADAKPVSPVTNAQHTAGPWTPRKAKHSSYGGWDWGIGAKVGMYERCIAEAFEVVDCGIKVNAEANARLIAAAPEMLVALRAARSCALPPEITDLIYEAIAQAEGREP